MDPNVRLGASLMELFRPKAAPGESDAYRQRMMQNLQMGQAQAGLGNTIAQQRANTIKADALAGDRLLEAFNQIMTPEQARVAALMVQSGGGSDLKATTEGLGALRETNTRDKIAAMDPNNPRAAEALRWSLGLAPIENARVQGNVIIDPLGGTSQTAPLTQLGVAMAANERSGGNVNLQSVAVPMSDGTTVMHTFNPRTGEYRRAQPAGTPAPAMNYDAHQEAVIAQLNKMVREGASDAEQQAFIEANLSKPRVNAADGSFVATTPLGNALTQGGNAPAWGVEPVKTDPDTARRNDEAANTAMELISTVDRLTSSPGFPKLGTVYGDVESNIPLVRTAAKDANSQLRTVANQVALSTMAKLKTMSAQGATGFGALNREELRLLMDAVASLEVSNISNEQLTANLAIIKEKMQKIYDASIAAAGKGGIMPPTGGGQNGVKRTRIKL